MKHGIYDDFFALPFVFFTFSCFFVSRAINNFGVLRKTFFDFNLVWFMQLDNQNNKNANHSQFITNVNNSGGNEIINMKL